MLKVYISGKITGLALEEAFIMFENAEEHLLRTGTAKEVVNPMKLVPYNPTLTWEDYMAEDIKHLLKCDAIYMLTNWGNSRGARVEYNIAKELGLQIMFQE